MRAGNRLRAAVAPELGPNAGEREQQPALVEGEPDDIKTTSFFFVSGFSSGAYFAKLMAETRQRFSGLSHPRPCGDEVLRMLVTGGPSRPLWRRRFLVSDFGVNLALKRLIFFRRALAATADA